MTSARRPSLLENPETRGEALAIAAGLLCVVIMAVLLVVVSRR